MRLGSSLKKAFSGGGEDLQYALDLAIAKTVEVTAPQPVVGEKAGGSFTGQGPWNYETYIQPTQQLTWTASEMYRNQPHIRTVISFLARNGAQCALQTFDRVSDTDRKRLTNSPSALLLSKPNSTTTGYELLYSLFSDLALYDNAYWWVTADSSSQSGYKLIAIPPEWVIGATYSDLWTPKTWWIQPRLMMNTNQMQIPAEQIIHFHGWNPLDPRTGYTPISALKAILDEQVAANKYRVDMWDNGAKTPGTINRPLDAPEWSPAAQKRFMSDFRAQFTGNGASVGSPAYMPDGMSYTNVPGFSSEQSQYIASVQLAFETVCGVYHVNPSLVGSSATTSYSNVKEFRKMLYGDTLGPVFEQVSQRVDNFLLPMIEEKPTAYVEFNIQAKLDGNFEEQSAALMTAVGGPWMTVNQARALNNMPSLGAEYDEIITPLNVVRGGGTQATPADTAPAPEDRTGPGDSQPEQQPKSAQTKSADKVTTLDKDLKSFLGRQYSVLASKLGAMEKRSVDQAWDSARWDKELADVIAPAAKKASLTASLAVLTKHNPDHDGWKAEVQHPYLDALALGRAQGINAVTKSAFGKALESNDWKTQLKTTADDRAASSENDANDIESDAAGFGSSDAAVASGLKTKTWQAGSNARESHAAMGGETVDMGDSFSNGQPWPGGPGGDASDAGCNCEVVFND